MGYTAGREGNLRNDSFHSYTWDAFGGVTAIDSYPITHDAFGRIVEFKSSPTYQILYAPTGADVAVMNGQTIFYGKVPLTGGGRAVFTSSGLNDYTHVDWQGSARFGSTPSRTMLFDMAYAPYGKIYAKMWAVRRRRSPANTGISSATNGISSIGRSIPARGAGFHPTQRAWRRWTP